jgi:uncharacterized protein (TIGR00290 family)
VAKRQKVLLSWSGGKDSVISFFELKSPDFKLLGLLTAISDPDRRMKNQISLDLLEAQAESLELPLITVPLSKEFTAAEWEEKMRAALAPMKASKLEGVAFGNSFQSEIKDRQDRFLSSLKLNPVYPLSSWKSAAVLKTFLGLGYKAIVVSVNTEKLPSTFVGRLLDWDFVEDLPEGVDPCGAHGEYQTFVYDGPFFQRAVPFQLGEKYQEGSYAFQELKLSKPA